MSLILFSSRKLTSQLLRFGKNASINISNPGYYRATMMSRCAPLVPNIAWNYNRLYTTNHKDNDIKMNKSLTDQGKHEIQFKSSTNAHISNTTNDVKSIDTTINDQLIQNSSSSSPKITENIYTIPNILTMTRIITTPIIGYCIINGDNKTAISLFIYSSITDFIDGYIARKFNMKSIVGSILDPMADKFLMTVCTLALSYQHIMSPYLAILIIGRDVMLSFWGFWIRYKTMPLPKTFKKFLDFRQTAVSVHPNLLGKINTGLQMILIGGLVLKPGLEMMIINDQILLLQQFFNVFQLVVAGTTFSSGLSYLFSKNSVKYIK